MHTDPALNEIPEALRSFTYNLEGAQHNVRSAIDAHDRLTKLGHETGPEWLSDSLRQALVTLAGVELLAGVEID